MTNGTKYGWAFAVALSALTLTAAGCGDDSESSADAGKVLKDAGSTVDASEEGYPDAGPATTEKCLQQAIDVKSKAPQKTIDCLCDKCLQEMNDCNLDEGCVDIRDCSDRTGCRGMGCYFAQKECMAIIDMYGATGYSVTLATQLNTCNDKMCQGGSDKDAGADDAGSDDAGN